jgi:ABC-2 type transport system permease protein
MSNRLGHLLKKEFAQIFRNLPLIIIVVWAFSVEVYLGGSAFSMDLQNYPIVVVDHSQSPSSRSLIKKIDSPHFKILDVMEGDQDVSRMMNRGVTAVAVIIPPGFERKLLDGQADIEVITDGTMSVSASLATTYLSGIGQDFSDEYYERRIQENSPTTQPVSRLDEKIRIAFNPNMIDAWFSSLFEFVFMLTLVSPLITASLLVREREQKTIEQLFITPATTTEIFLSKIIPTVTIVMAIMPVSLFGIVNYVFGTPFRGSYLLFFSVAFLYVTTMSSLGVAIASLARNMAQTLIITMLTVTPMMFLSGIFSPPEATPDWVSLVNQLFPLKHFQEIAFNILIKGNGVLLLWDHILWIAVLGTTLFLFSHFWFHRSVT